MTRRSQPNICRRGFTLVELLIVIIVIAVLAAIAIPKFVNSSERSKEASLHADLKLVRNAIQLFNNDTGCYPAVLTDLAATTAPASGKDATGAAYTINATDYKGPYIASVPNDPTLNVALTYNATTPPNVGTVISSNTGNDSTGVAFSTY